MPSTKHLPIQPYPANGHSIISGTTTSGNPTPIMIAPSSKVDNTHGSSSSVISSHGDGHSRKSTGSSTGLTIRTSRHWVLPPRPKPGRKPNHNQQSHDQHNNHYNPHCNTNSSNNHDKRKPVIVKEIATQRSNLDVGSSGSKTKVVLPAPVAFKKDLSKLPIKNINPPTCLNATTSPPPSITPITSPSSIITKKQTKTALKKEINNIKVQNTKLKQELGQLVGNLQDLKRKYNTKNLATPAKTKPVKPSNKNKRHYLDDSTLAFLKFEEEDDNDGDVLNVENKNGDVIESDPVMLPPLLISNAKMNLTSSTSVSSCKTTLTDDEDILTMSSSTPNSLFSADLQHSSSLSSASSLNLNTNNSCGGNINGDYQSPVCPNTNSKNSNQQLKFLDGYEQMAFYDKYMRMDLNLPSELATNINVSDNDNNIGLDSIKEEENDCKFYDNNNDNNLLDFIQSHNNNDNKFIKNELPPFNDNDNKDTKPCDLFFNIKQESDDLFQTLSLDNNQTITTITSASSNTNYYLPPSLEELMEEQDGGVVNTISEKCFKNFSMMTNNINDLTLTSADDCDDDFDMLKVEVFDMV